MAGTRREEAARLAPYFEVQLRFAEAMARLTGRPLSQTCLDFTNLHRRLGFGRVEGGAPAAAWGPFAARLERCRGVAERLAWTTDAFAAQPPEASEARRFGCFSFELMAGGETVRIHFGNRDTEDDSGPLTAAKAPRRRAELREMFAFVRALHPHARTVLGGSWLYNLQAYRRLFPPEYAASLFQPARVRLDGTSSWGQLLDWRGDVKPAVRDALLANLAALDPAAPWTAFPLRALGVRADIGAFRRFYGV